jgi:hypothetical protein
LETSVKIRTAALLAAPLAACLTMSAQAAPPTAAPKPLVLTDPKGDANGINNQGLVSGTPVPDGTATPAAVDATDITGLTVAATGSMAKRKVGKKMVSYFSCTGYTVTLQLAAAPLPTAALYRVQGATPLHDTFWLEYSEEAGATATTTLRYTDAAATLGTSSIAIAPAKIDGSKIVFTVTGGNLKATGGEALGKTILTSFGADVRFNGKAQGGGITAPMFDQLVTDGSQTWKVCPA